MGRRLEVLAFHRDIVTIGTSGRTFMVASSISGCGHVCERRRGAISRSQTKVRQRVADAGVRLPAFWAKRYHHRPVDIFEDRLLEMFS
jgi:aminoglycoside N3'-acetyltransferase